MYSGAWIVYLMTSFTLCVIMWWMTRDLRFSVLKNALRFWLAIILFVPAQVLETGQELSPAFMVFIFTYIKHGYEQAAPVAAPLVAAFSIATFVIIVVPFVNWVRRPKEDASPEAANTPPIEEQATNDV